MPYAHAAPGNTIELQCFYRPARQGHVRSRRKPTLVGLKGKSEDQPHAKQIAPAEGVTPPAEVRVSFLTTPPLDTRRRLSVQLGPRRGHESAWCLLGFAGGNHADRAGFRHVFCLQG